MAQLIVIVTKTFFMAKDPYRGAASNLRDHGSLPLGLFGHGARCGFTGLASVMVDGAWWRRCGLPVLPPGTVAGALRRPVTRRPVTRRPSWHAAPPHRRAQGNHAQLTLAGIAPELPVIAKTFSIAKTFGSWRANFFRHAKSLHDHGDAPGCRM
jgi:hypothetical protein